MPHLETQVPETEAHRTDHSDSDLPRDSNTTTTSKVHALDNDSKGETTESTIQQGTSDLLENTQQEEANSNDIEQTGIPSESPDKTHTTRSDNDEGVEDDVDELEEFIEEEEDLILINIKDFAYAVSDPRHFGIYDDDDDDEDEDEDNEEEEDDEDYVDYDASYDQNEYGYYDDHGIYHHPRQQQFQRDNNDNGEASGEYTNDENTNNGRNFYNEPQEPSHEDYAYVNEENNNTDILHAVALYEFTPENSNELPLIPDQILIINYECGDGWLVAHDPSTGQTGLVPSEYIRILEIDSNEEEYEEDMEAYNEFAEDAKDAQRFMPEILSVDNHPDHDNEESTNSRLTETMNKLSL